MHLCPINLIIRRLFRIGLLAIPIIAHAQIEIQLDVSNPYRISTIAGSNIVGLEDGIGPLAKFSGIEHVAVDRSGNVFLNDSGWIRRVSNAGIVTTITTKTDGGSLDGSLDMATFRSPEGLAVDEIGNIYIADQGNHKIRKIDANGIVTTIAGSGAIGMVNGESWTARFSYPSDIAVDRRQNVYVVDDGNRIRKISSNGLVTTLAVLGPNLIISDIAVDKDGALYFCNYGKIMRITPDGVATTYAGTGVSGWVDGPALLAQFRSPDGLTVDDEGNVYVSDKTLIRKITPSGLVKTIAGNLSDGANDGVGAGASVNSYLRIGSDAGGQIYFGGSSTIRKGVPLPSQNIDFGSLATRSYGTAPFSLNATATSGLLVSYSIVSGPASISGNTITITGAGIVIVRASQAGNDNYAPAPSVEQTLTVAQASQIIDATSIVNRPTGSGTTLLSATASSGLPVSYSIVSGAASINGSFLSVMGVGPITMRVSQEGNVNYFPAPDTLVSVMVTPNTAAPTSFVPARTWFYDDIPINGFVTTFSGIDPDFGDLITYSFASGLGADDNAKFSLISNSLRKISNQINYNLQRTASIRVRATDLAGQFIERVFVLNVLPAVPNAKFIPAGIPFTQAPNYVNAYFQLVGKSTGRSLSYPRSFFDPSSSDYQPDLFQVFEGATLNSSTSPIAFNESYFQVGKISDVPSKVRTIILLDNSSSISIADLAVIRAAAKVMVDSMFEEQEIAVYTFSGTHTLIQGFLGKTAANQATLKAAIDTIGRGSATTNLYGSMLAMLNVPAWTESFSTNGINTGFLVALTDGADSSGSATKEQVIAKRDLDGKRIYTIGLGAAVEPLILQELQNTNFYISASNSAALATAFENIQRDIIDLANSYYRINYISPKRQSNPLGTLRKMEVKLKNNINTSADRLLSTAFNSDSFIDLDPAMYINRTVDKLTGINEFEELKISPNVPSSASAITLFPPLDFSNFTWSIGNPALATLTPQGIIGERVIITPNGQNGTTTLTLTDTISNIVGNFSKTITLKIGTGVTLSLQTITFPTIADRVPTSPVFTITASASSSLPVSFSLVSGPATVSGNTVTLTGSVGTVAIRANQAGNASFAAANPETRSFTVASSGVLLTNWASSSGLSGPNTSPTATPFNDGVENLLKYAFNMNAAGPDVSVLNTGGSSGLPQITIDSSGAEPVLKVAFLRRKGSGLIYTPQRSTTLGNFVAMTGTQTVTSIDAQWERVSVEEPAPPATAPRAFARVQVTLP